jgi:serine acetyltransferase
MEMTMHKSIVTREWVFQDWAANAGRPDIRLFLAWFRIAQWAYIHWGTLGRLVYTPYTAISVTFLSIELPVSCSVGPGLCIYHKSGITIHKECTIGRDCQLRQGVTLGVKQNRNRDIIGFPTVGDDVDLGGYCAVIGDIYIGDHSRIGAHTVVTKSVPDWAIVVGNPGRVIRIDAPEPSSEGSPPEAPNDL